MTTWTINYASSTKKDFKKLDKSMRQDVLKFINERLATTEDSNRFGKPLRHNKLGLWHYRVGKARVLCQIRGNELVVLVVKVGLRKNVYEDT